MGRIEEIEARADQATTAFRLYADGGSPKWQPRSWWVCPCRQHTIVPDENLEYTCARCGRTWALDREVEDAVGNA